MHAHYSASAAIGAFLSILLLGTLWRVSAAKLMASGNATLNSVGQTMIVQY